MKGHIRERSPGHWAIVIDVRDSQTGKRKRRWHSFAGTKRQAQVKCAELVAAAGKGDYIEPSKATVAPTSEKHSPQMIPKPKMKGRGHEGTYSRTITRSLGHRHRRA